METVPTPRRRGQRSWTDAQRAEQAAKLRARKIWLKSTGPKTEEGKAASSQNATTHGCYRIEFKQICLWLRMQRHFIQTLVFIEKNGLFEDENEFQISGNELIDPMADDRMICLSDDQKISDQPIIGSSDHPRNCKEACTILSKPLKIPPYINDNIYRDILMNFQALKNIDVKGKTVLLRADLNVPAEGGNITDTTRIDRLSPTIDFLTKNGAKTLVISHFGRPKGVTPEFSLKFMLPALEKSWGVKVGFADDCIGAPAEAAKAALQNGQVTLLENVRFHAEEEKNDVGFTKQLASLGDIYCNDAFSAAHRAHASTEGLAHFLPSCAGFLMEAELNALTAALENPQRPVMAIVGGSKISTKISVLENLVKKVDFLFLGGGMANTFLFADGVEVGKSLCERDMVDEAKRIQAAAKASGCEILLPVDRVIVDKFGANAPHEIVLTAAMPADREAVDVGPQTIAMLTEKLAGCKTVLWNGPLGVFEVTPFDKGTTAAAQAVAAATAKGLVSVAGGGDTVSALEHAGCGDKFTYVSSAGGAFLEWMEGKPLPGVDALSSQKKAA